MKNCQKINRDKEINDDVCVRIPTDFFVGAGRELDPNAFKAEVFDSGCTYRIDKQKAVHNYGGTFYESDGGKDNIL